MAAGALGEQRVLADELHARLEIGGGCPVLADAHVAGRDAAHRPGIVVEHFLTGEPGENLHTQRFRLLSQPAHDVAEAHDVVAVVDEALRQQRVRDRDGLRLREQPEPVVAHRRVERRALRLPVGQELGQRDRVHHRARQDVRADLGTLFEDDDAHVLAGFCRALLDADRRRETGGAAADDHDVVFHCFALHADVLAVTAGTQLYNPRRRQEFPGCVSGDAPSRIVFASRRKKP